MTHGCRNAGYALFVKEGRLHYIHNYVGLKKFEVVSSEPVPTGDVSLRYEFEPTGDPQFREGKGSPGRFQLYINDHLVGNLEVPYTVPMTFGVLGASCGYAAFDSVNPEVYEAPFRFTGEIKQVMIDVSGEVIKDDEAELKRLMTQQ
jgi:arylsulfatase